MKQISKKIGQRLLKSLAIVWMCCSVANVYANPKTVPQQNRVQVLNTSPYVVLFHQFLNNEECAHLIKTATPSLERATVAYPDREGGFVSSSRTSEGMFIDYNADPIISKIEERIAYCTRISKENGENIQILRYLIGQEFQPHHDYFEDEMDIGGIHTKDGGNRQATVLMYLSTPEEGGETAFPLLNIKIKPVKGDALLFYNCDSDGRVNPRSLHQGIPVKRGEKWVATKWLRFSRYQEAGSQPLVKKHTED